MEELNDNIRKMRARRDARNKKLIESGKKRSRSKISEITVKLSKVKINEEHLSKKQRTKYSYDDWCSSNGLPPLNDQIDEYFNKINLCDYK